MDKKTKTVIEYLLQSEDYVRYDITKHNKLHFNEVINYNINEVINYNINEVIN